MGWRLRSPAIEDIGLIAIGGWLGASAVFAVGFTIVSGAVMVTSEGLSSLMLLPPLLFVTLFGAGLASVALALPVILVCTLLLQVAGVGPQSGAAVLFGLSCLYALGLARTSDPWSVWSHFWYAAPIYGLAAALIYLRTIDA